VYNIKTALRIIGANNQGQVTVYSRGGELWICSQHGAAHIGAGDCNPQVVSVRALLACDRMWEVGTSAGSVTFGDGAAVLTNLVDVEPVPLAVPTDKSIAIPRAVLAEAIGMRQFCSTDHTRPRICAVHVVSDGKSVICEATDGMRLVRSKLEVSMEAIETIVPAKLLARVDAAKFPDVSLLRDGSECWLIGDGFACMAEVDNLPFPRIDSVVPDRSGSDVFMSYDQHKAFFGTVVAAASKHKRNDKGVSLTFGDKVRIDTLHADFQNVSLSRTFDSDGCSADIPKFGINAKYLLDALKWLGGEVVLRVKDDKSPIRIDQCEGVEGRERVAVVMPLRL